MRKLYISNYDYKIIQKKYQEAVKAYKEALKYIDELSRSEIEGYIKKYERYTKQN